MLPVELLSIEAHKTDAIGVGNAKRVIEVLLLQYLLHQVIEAVVYHRPTLVQWLVTVTAEVGPSLWVNPIRTRRVIRPFRLNPFNDLLCESIPLQGSPVKFVVPTEVAATIACSGGRP